MVLSRTSLGVASMPPAPLEIVVAEAGTWHFGSGDARRSMRAFGGERHTPMCSFVAEAQTVAQVARACLQPQRLSARCILADSRGRLCSGVLTFAWHGRRRLITPHVAPC